MKRYVGLLSEVKDITHKNQTDVDAYVQIAKKYNGKILELGSGSGHISLGLAQEGYQVTCLEIHRDMIHLHKEKLSHLTEDNTTLVLGDMCSFELNEKFDLIIAAQNVINALKTKEDVLQMLTSVKKHLSDVGVFVVECDYPSIEEMKKLHDLERVESFKNPRSQMNIEQKIKSKYDTEKMTRTDNIVVTEYIEKRIKRRIQVIQEYKLWTVDELELMFRQANLQLMLTSGSLSNIEPMTPQSKYMVFFLKV